MISLTPRFESFFNECLRVFRIDTRDFAEERYA
jgi:hypothetical protein